MLPLTVVCRMPLWRACLLIISTSRGLYSLSSDFINCLTFLDLFSLSVILGGGILGLPDTLDKSGFYPFLVTFLLTYLMQVGETPVHSCILKAHWIHCEWHVTDLLRNYITSQVLVVYQTTEVLQYARIILSRSLDVSPAYIGIHQLVFQVHPSI